MTTRHDAITHALAAATETMHAQGEVPAMIIAHTDQALMTFPMAHVMTTDEVKDAAGMAVGAEMRKRNARVYVFMSEAWLAVLKPGEDPREGPPPSERPDRIKALVLSASDGDEDTLVTYRTVRNARGRSRH